MATLATSIQIDRNCDHIILLNDMAVKYFNAKSAHEVNAGVFNIDDGLNDVRTYFDLNNRGISFVCRYEKDISYVKRRIEEFVAENESIKVTL